MTHNAPVRSPVAATRRRIARHLSPGPVAGDNLQPRVLARRLVLGLIIILALLALVPGAPARAAIRESSFTFDPPQNPPSLTPLPPAAEQAPRLERVSIAYDDRAGRLTTTARLYSPQFWGQKLPRITFHIGADGCGEDADGVVSIRNAELTQWMGAGDPDIGAPSTQMYTYATRDGYEGQAEGTMTFDGATFTATVTNPGLAGLDARCVLIDGASYNAGLWLHSGALSYAPIDLSRRTAERAMRAALGVRFGAAWKSASRRYMKCSPGDFEDGEGGRTTGCFAEFGRGRKWRFVSWSANAAAGDYRVLMQGKPFVYRWTRRWRRQSVACRRSWHIQGTLWSNSGGCAAHLASNYFRGVMYTSGVGTGYFPALFRYPCRRHGRVLQCTNALGDSVRWRR